MKRETQRNATLLVVGKISRQPGGHAEQNQQQMQRPSDDVDIVRATNGQPCNLLARGRHFVLFACLRGEAVDIGREQMDLGGIQVILVRRHVAVSAFEDRFHNG